MTEHVKEKISRIAARNRKSQQNRVNKLPPVLQIAGSAVHLSRKKLVCAGAFEEIASFQFYCSIDWKKKLKQNSWVSPDVNIICLHLQEVIHGIISKMFCLSLES